MTRARPNESVDKKNVKRERQLIKYKNKSNKSMTSKKKANQMQMHELNVADVKLKRISADKDKG